jgi:hypothetical protein
MRVLEHPILFTTRTHIAVVLLLLSCNLKQVEQTSENTVALHSLGYTKKHLKLQLKHLVVITLV